MGHRMGRRGEWCQHPQGEDGQSSEFGLEERRRTEREGERERERGREKNEEMSGKEERGSQMF